jgi:hypothetical protein
VKASIVRSKGIFRALAAQEIRIKKFRDRPKRSDKTDCTPAHYSLAGCRKELLPCHHPPFAFRALSTPGLSG